MSEARDQEIGRLAAIAVVILVGVFAVIGPGWTGTNLLVAEFAGGTPNVPPGPGVSTRDRWAGALPLPMPAWALLALVAALMVLLVVVWRPSRHYFAWAWRRRMILSASPGFVAFLSLFVGFSSLDAASYFVQPDGSYGFQWIAGVLGLGTAAVGGLRAYVTRSAARRKG